MRGVGHTHKPYTHTYTHSHTNPYTHTQTHKHTHRHTHIYTCSPRDSQESSPTPQFKSINSSVLSFLYYQLASAHRMLCFLSQIRPSFPRGSKSPPIQGSREQPIPSRPVGWAENEPPGLLLTWWPSEPVGHSIVRTASLALQPSVLGDTHAPENPLDLPLSTPTG